MFRNRRAWFDRTFKLAKQGYKDWSDLLIKDTIKSLKDDELNDSQRDFLIDCLERLLETDDAEKGFCRKFERGKQKKAKAARDESCAIVVHDLVQLGLTVEEAIEKAMKFSDKEFPEAYHDYKSIEEAYYKYKKQIETKL